MAPVGRYQIYCVRIVNGDLLTVYHKNLETTYLIFCCERSGYNAIAEIVALICYGVRICLCMSVLMNVTESEYQSIAR